MSFRPLVTGAALAVLGTSGTFVGKAVDALRAVAPTAAALTSPLSEGLPLRNPTTVGMSAERLAAVDRVVLSGIAAGGYPGAAVVVGRGGYAVVKRGYGHLGWTADSPNADEHSIYDLASLTKVVGTTAAIMVLYDEGKIDLDAPVRHYLPAFSGGLKDLVTVRHLLLHRSGLPAGRDLWRLTSSPAEARRIVLETPIYCHPGDCYEYSDLGADVLGFIAETVSGERLDAFLARRVYGPLGMNDTDFRPPAPLRNRIAPTEVSPPRGYPLRGEVHDENAYALGGVAGHAGLFSSAADLSIFAQTLLNGGQYAGVRVFADSTVRLFTRRATGSRALGWDTCTNGSTSGSCGSLMGENAFGHTGFTGTSIWIDPDRNMFVVLLTNRVHEARAARPAKVIADVRADLADAAELAVLDDPRGVHEMPASFRADDEAGWNRAPARARHASRRASRSHKHAGKGAHESRGRSHHGASHASPGGSSAKAKHSAAKSGGKSAGTKHGHSSKRRG
ncbi:hypothetical protein tb265_08100 [Gemmatimonadetes bacterium T265]|nr:hypothetical protein tb265_08100 [Gemmatimonadetes bacterium T265]